MIGECKIEQKIVQNPIFKKLVLGTYQFHTLCVKQPMEEMTYLSH
jgi:hypothetical protein